MELTDMEFDALREVGNVGVGNAATALSKLLNKPVDISLPETKFIPIAKFGQWIGGPETVVEALTLETTGGLHGQSIFLFPIQGALNIIDMMMFQEMGTTKEITEMAESAFKEMGNIVVGAYLSSLADMMQVEIFPGLPQVANDMAQAVLDNTLISLSQSAEEILVVKTAINIDGYSIDGHFFLLLEDNSLKIVLDKLKEIYGL